MNVIRRINSGIARFETWILVCIVLFMVCAAFSQVILRNFFNYAIEGADIFLRHLVLWIGFIGASLATRDEKHIAIDLLTRFDIPLLKKITPIISNIFSAAISFILMYASWLFVVSEKEYDTVLFSNSLVGDVSAWYLEIIIPIGFAMTGLRFVLNCFLPTEKNDEGELET